MTRNHLSVFNLRRWVANPLKVFKYLVVGSVAALVDLFVFWAMTELAGIHWTIAAPISFAISTVAHYFLSIRLVFVSGIRFQKWHEFSLIVLVSLIGMLVNQLALWLFIEILHVDSLISKILADVVVFFWNYLSRSAYIFSPRVSSKAP